MDPRAFHSLAVELIEGGDSSHVRTAIGRAYYAAFNFAAAILRDNGFSIPENHMSHEQVTRHLLGSEDEEVKRVGSQLSDMRGMRNKADYRLSMTIVEDKTTGKAIVANAGRCIKSLGDAFSGTRKATIIAAIQAWKKKAYGG